MKTLQSIPEVVKDENDFATQLIIAEEFFGDGSLPEPAVILAGENPYSDKDGLVEFIIGNESVGDPIIMEKISTQKKVLIALTSIVTDYVNRYAQKYGPKYKTDAELWSLALSKIPLMGPSKIDKQTYTRHISGLEIAKDFIDFILEIVVSEKSSALDSFSKFLEKQGEALRFGVNQNTDYYKTITIGVSIEVGKVGEENVYIPKIKQYRVNFDRTNVKFSSACASAEAVDINFEYQYGANVFDYEALEDHDIKEKFDSFIRKSRKAQIENSDTFFNGDFDLESGYMAK